jgi:hypothetical protein
MGLLPSLFKIMKPRPPPPRQTISQPAMPRSSPFEEALASEAKQIGVNRTAIERPTQADPEFFRCQEAICLCECVQNFGFGHFISIFGVIKMLYASSSFPRLLAYDNLIHAFILRLNVMYLVMADFL